MEQPWIPLRQTATEQIARTQARISALDKAGPCLNAVLEWNPDAEAIARGLDRFASLGGQVSGLLHGMPILLKDNIATADGMHTSAGALALRDRYAPAEAFLAARLRAAGAVLCGKANMTELANFMTENMPNGYSSRGGQVRHVWKPDGDPSGSSTGSAVAVAAGYVPVAIGTETCGSIISPAMQAGISAIKPSVGWVSRSGIIPISPSQDTAGPMARDMRTCARALEAMLGVDPEDPATHAAQGHPLPDRTACEWYREGLSGLRIGVYRKEESGVVCEQPAFHQALETLQRLGAELVDVSPPQVELSDMMEVLVHEFRPAMDAVLRHDTGSIRTLAALAAYNTAHAETCLRYGQVWVEKALTLGHPLLSSSYLGARARIRKAERELEDLFASWRLSAVASPNGLFVIPVTGAASATFPVGMDETTGLPVPIVLEVPRYADAVLLAVGTALEDAVRVDWRPIYPFEHMD